jgi:hypothetical protein
MGQNKRIFGYRVQEMGKVVPVCANGVMGWRSRQEV